MNNTGFIEQIKFEIEKAFIQNKKSTKLLRTLSSKAYQKIKGKSISEVFGICEQLLEERRWEFWIIAYDLAFRKKDAYDKNTFDIFERWLYKYVSDWKDCDDFCTHAFGELIAQDNSLYKNVLKWIDSDNFAVRRAAAVVLIYPIRKNRYEGIDPFIVVERLKNDEHYLVQKGYGWMLKILSEKEPDNVYYYLEKNKENMPRLALRYAVEKMDEEQQKILID